MSSGTKDVNAAFSACRVDVEERNEVGGRFGLCGVLTYGSVRTGPNPNKIRLKIND